MKHALPIVIGVTGHRYLRPEDEALLRRTVRDYLQSLQQKYPHTELRLLTGLAEGADSLCAEEAAGLGISYTAVLPVEKEVFTEDFQGAARERFLALLQGASAVILAPAVERPEGAETRDFRFRQVDIYLVEHSQVLLALWDGAAAKEGGCGTAETVDMLVNGSYAPAGGRALRSLENACLAHILAPRKGAEGAEAGRLTLQGNESLLAGIEQRNLLAAGNAADS